MPERMEKFQNIKKRVRPSDGGQRPQEADRRSRRDPTAAPRAVGGPAAGEEELAMREGDAPRATAADSAPAAGERASRPPRTGDAGAPILIFDEGIQRSAGRGEGATPRFDGQAAAPQSAAGAVLARAREDSASRLSPAQAVVMIDMAIANEAGRGGAARVARIASHLQWGNGFTRHLGGLKQFLTERGRHYLLSGHGSGYVAVQRTADASRALETGMHAGVPKDEEGMAQGALPRKLAPTAPKGARQAEASCVVASPPLRSPPSPRRHAAAQGKGVTQVPKEDRCRTTAAGVKVMFTNWETLQVWSVRSHSSHILDLPGCECREGETRTSAATRCAATFLKFGAGIDIRVVEQVIIRSAHVTFPAAAGGAEPALISVHMIECQCEGLHTAVIESLTQAGVEEYAGGKWRPISALQAELSAAAAAMVQQGNAVAAASYGGFERAIESLLVQLAIRSPPALAALAEERTLRPPTGAAGESDARLTDERASAGLLLGNLARDRKQDVGYWVYDLAGTYEVVEGRHDFRHHYRMQRKSSGASGVEQIMSVSIHYRREGESHEVGWYFADSPGGEHRYLHHAEAGPYPPPMQGLGRDQRLSPCV